MRPVYLIIATLTCYIAFPTRHSNLKIYGGKTAESGQFPFTVAINATYYAHVWCEGSIIHENWILTTAMCSEYHGWNADQLVVISGTNQLDIDAGVVYNVSRIVAHPNFTVENFPEANIALFQIDGSFTFSDLVQSIELGEVSVNDSVVVAGWGATLSQNYPALQYAKLTAWSNEDCRKESSVIRPEEVCAFGGKWVGICGGDTGAPLVLDGTLVGIGSWLIGPCGGGQPDVYTRVSYYKDWINSVINS